MNSEVDITCDRCGQVVHGVIIESPLTPKITGGFYDVSVGSWSAFAQLGETNVCDKCMWADPAFTRQYPMIRKLV